MDALVGACPFASADCLAPPDMTSADDAGACETKGREGGEIIEM